jgi:DNA-binding NtrC family response regulator
MKDRVLVVEDDASMGDLLIDALTFDGFEVARVDNLAKSFSEVLKSPPNVILADYQLPGGTAFDLLEWLRARDLRIPVVVVTGHASIDLAVEAVKAGADQFIAKPVDIGYLTTVLTRTLENARNQQKTLAAKLERSRYERNPFLGNSPAILELRKTAQRVAEANSTTVLIQGETGTGKGVLARWLHKNGQRSDQSFVDLNCAGFSLELLESELFGHKKGAFTGAVANRIGFLEASNYGTLFLDEIGDMDSQVQSKILKVVEEKQFYRLGDVQERKVDVQIIAATHRDLKRRADEGKFRSDLYFRISTLRLRIPPLRERAGDIPILTDRLLEQLSNDMQRGPFRISDSARHTLQNYSWPGNIRELRNVLERAALLSDDRTIQRTGLELETSPTSESPAQAVTPNLTLREMERRHILQVLASEGGKVAQAAHVLGMPRSSLYVKIREHGL